MEKINIALGIEYKGSNYHGWQKQKHSTTIQQYLENALSYIANEKITTFCAGRTDSGVHALGQVVNFFTRQNRSIESWTKGVNSKLPKDISVIWAKIVPKFFNARFSAIARCYRYIIYNNKIRSSIYSQLMFHYHEYLDNNKMNNASQLLVGENDFSSFRSSTCQSNSPYRNLFYISVIRYKNFVYIDLKANSFLHNMVRIIVGNLIEIGRRKKNEKWLYELLLAKKRTLSAATAKAEGLYLVSVIYPKFFNLPNSILKIF